MTIFREEVFGPFVAISSFKDEAEAIRRANNTTYGLGAAVFTENITKAHRVARRIEAGMVWINSSNDSDTRVPFGGVKQSGIGRELGEAGLEAYTNRKACLHKQNEYPAFANTTTRLSMSTWEPSYRGPHKQNSRRDTKCGLPGRGCVVTWASKISALGATAWATDVILMDRGWRKLDKSHEDRNLVQFVPHGAMMTCELRRVTCRCIARLWVTPLGLQSQKKCLIGGIFFLLIYGACTPLAAGGGRPQRHSCSGVALRGARA